MFLQGGGSAVPVAVFSLGFGCLLSDLTLTLPTATMFLGQIIRAWIGGMQKRRQLRHFVSTIPCEILDQRCLLTIVSLTATVEGAVNGQDQHIEIHWQISGTLGESKYEVWLDQVLSAKARNSKVYHRLDVTGSTPDSTLNITHRIDQQLAAGTYRVWVRGSDGANLSQWASHTFEVDDDGNPETPIQEVAPERPEITVIRQGQGAAGQAISEGGIGWTGNSVLYDVWLGKQDTGGTLRAYAQIKNVPQNTIALRELALASSRVRRTTYSDVQADSDLAQLESGDYQFFVRGINGAIDDAGRWKGQGDWSRGERFSFYRVEGTDAIPGNLNVTAETRLTVEWDPVAYADAYFVSFWKGPDYSSNPPVNIKVNGTRFVASGGRVEAGGQTIGVNPGDEFFIRVRAIGSEGMLEGLRAGNFASATVAIPASVSASEIGTPDIKGPAAETANSMPILRWNHAVHADSYDVWFTSLQTRRRMFLANGITDNVLHLRPQVLLQMSDLPSELTSEFKADGDLADGRYRFWVRGRNSVASVGGTWSTSYDFTVDSTGLTNISLLDDSNPAAQPLLSPRLIERYVENRQQNILIANGLGESFGASVLARYIPDDSQGLVRPVVNDSATGIAQLRYPDLSVGNNVTDMAFLDDEHLIVLSRGSSDVRVIDLANWQVISEFALMPGAGGRAPDVMDLEVLSNGQIMIVSNRSDRLRLLDVDSNYQLTEVDVPESTPDDQGFQLPHGRAVQLSAVPRSDGTYSVFLATPTVQGIVTAIYDPTTLKLTPAVNEDGTERSVISRSTFATPHLGGRTAQIATGSGALQTFYLSTDRNGFLTWVNVDTLAFGFIDLVQHIDFASRDPLSEDYKNPDDAHVDPSRIIQIDANTIVVLNNRAFSVILGLETDGENALRVRSASTFDNGYGAAVFSLPSGAKIYSSAGSANGPQIGPDNVIVAELNLDSSFNTWSAGELTGFVLADPVKRASVVGSDSIILEFHAGRTSTVSAVDTEFNNTKSALQLFTAEGTAYADRGSPAATYFDPASGKLFLIAHLALSGGIGAADEHYLGVVDVSLADAPVLHSVYLMPPDLRWYFVEFTADRIAVLDRLGSEVVTLSNWMSPDTAILRTVNFADRLPRTYGEIHSGRIRTLADGTNVVLHDTAPHRVFAVYEPQELNSASSVATVHTNTAGQWIYDAHVFDED